MSPITVLGFSGSLRQGSYNTALLRAALELAPEDMRLQTYDLAPIPMYNQDLWQGGLPPAAAHELRQRIAAVDALLIVTPEYNYSIPGVLKNAIDWASRPPNPPLDDKPVAIMGASAGGFGTVRGQHHLRQVCVFTNMHALNRPEVLVSRAADKFDEQGRLTDEPTRKIVRDLLVALVAWTRRLKNTG